MKANVYRGSEIVSYVSGKRLSSIMMHFWSADQSESAGQKKSGELAM